MTADVFGDAPEAADGEIDPLSPEHVVTLVRFLASPAAKDVNGQVFIVYGPQVTLMAAPTVEHRFDADAQAWDPGKLSDELQDYFAGRDPKRNFAATGVGGLTDRVHKPLWYRFSRTRTRFRMIWVTMALTC